MLLLASALFLLAAAQSDMLEIESSKLALTKSDSDKTKQFARKMIKDHTETSNELKALLSGGKAGATAPSGLDKAHEDAVSMFERHGKDGDNAGLKAFAGKTLPHLQEHLKMAQELGK
jgi:putative membrane protein